VVRAGLTTEIVTRAAADLADQIGFDKITVSAVARGFGVADASLYSHIRNLDDLRHRVAVLAARDFADRLGTAVAGRSRRDALIGFAGAYRSFAVEHPGRYAATQLELPAETLAASTGHMAMLTLTGATIQAYGLPEPDDTDAVRLLRSTFHGFADLESTGAFRHSRDIDRTWDRIVAVLADALENWHTKGGPT